jgi:flagellar biosynthesis/type III secretory pathway M-ring protein FliF/YscJ
MPFDLTLASEPPADLIPPPPPKPGAQGGPAAPAEPLWKQRNIQIIAGASLGGVLLLAGVAYFLLKRKKKAGVTVEGQAGAIEGASGTAGADGSKQLPAAEPVDPEKKAADEAALEAAREKEVLAGIKLPEITTKKGEVLKRHIRDEIKKSPEQIAHVVRTWLNAHNED